MKPSKSYKQILVISLAMMLFSFSSSIAEIDPIILGSNYHEQIEKLWQQRKPHIIKMIENSRFDPYNLYNVQNETNNLLKYTDYCKKYKLLDELISVYFKALDTLTETDQYLFAYYPDSPRLSIHPLDKKYRMWIDSQKPIGQESILVSSQFLYLLSDTVGIISDIKKEHRTPLMKEALNQFIPLLIEHYNRWIFLETGPFQVRGWGCKIGNKYVKTAINHNEFIEKKLRRELGDDKSPSYCNAVNDTDMWIIAGVANLCYIYKKENSLVPITQIQYKKFINYLKTGLRLLESRFSYTELKDFDGKPVTGAIFDAGAWDDHPDYAYAGYTDKQYPDLSQSDKNKYKGKGVGWDLSHARRFVHVFGTLMKTKDILGLDFPTKSLMEMMANQLVYATFNRDFKKPLFTNFMDGTNGWYRVGYSGRKGFGYRPWSITIHVLTGGYAFWHEYNSDIKKVYDALINAEINSKNFEDPETQSLLIQFFPSLCFMMGC